jgi:hypothetical protein
MSAHMMPVVLANPSRKGRRKKKPRRKTTRASSRKRNPSRRRRRNPSSKWSDAVTDGLLGGLGGGVAVLAAKGAEMIPIAPVGQIAIQVVAGLAGAAMVAKWGSTAAGAGLGGGTVALGGLRGVEIWTLSRATKEARGELPAAPESAGLFAARSRVEAGAVVLGNRPAPASMSGNPVSPDARTVPEAGYPRRWLPSGSRLMGPRGWAAEGGTVYRMRSAHNA